MGNLKKRKKPVLLRVIRKKYISHNLLRVTLSGSALTSFPANKNGAHIKLFIPRKGEQKPALPELKENKIIWPANKPDIRTYSVRDYRPTLNELDIDFVAHGASSPASGWAINARVGDFLGVSLPGGPDPLLSPADWHILAGDLTAVPAISAILETLPENASGHVFIEVSTPDDQHFIFHPKGIRVNWLIKTDKKHMPLPEAIATVAPPIGVKRISAFVAGENASVIQCRDRLIADYQLTKKDLYAVPYWRQGQDEETYHAQRHTIMDQVY